MQRRRHQSERVRVLGRLSLVGAVVLCACESESTPSVPKSRAAVVTASAPQPAKAALSVAPSAALPTEGSQRKDPLCQGQLSGKGTPLPTAEISGAGEPLPPERMETGGGWTWVNFWAAWCVPCREEIPRLLSWQSKLGPGKLRVAFVSLDDDARQLQDFLKAQPKAGLRATHWLHDGKEREEWLAEAGMDVDPELPAHLLVDPAGHVRCRVSGAIEDADFARVREIVGG